MNIVVWISLEDDPTKLPKNMSSTFIDLQNHTEEFFMGQLELASVVTVELDDE